MSCRVPRCSFFTHDQLINNLNLFCWFSEEFQRAVYISTGQTLDPYVVHTVFELFDKDGEMFNALSHAVQMFRYVTHRLAPI